VKTPRFVVVWSLPTRPLYSEREPSLTSASQSATTLLFAGPRLTSGLIEALFVTFDGRVVAGLVQKIYKCLPVGLGCLTPEGPIDGRP
jgi:hypothetical protein